MNTSSFSSFAIHFYYFILLGESEDYRTFFRQIFPVIGKSVGSFNFFIESSNFVFIDGECDVARREFKSLAAKVAFKILFFRELVSNISFLVDGKGVI